MEIKLLEVGAKKGNAKSLTGMLDVSLIKIELKLSKWDFTQGARTLAPALDAKMAEMKAAGHDVRLRGHVGVQWEIPASWIARRNPYVLGALIGAGISMKALQLVFEASIEMSRKVASTAKTLDDIGDGILGAIEMAAYRPALEALIVADPDNTEYSKELNEDDIGVLSDVGLRVQHDIWNVRGLNAAEARMSTLVSEEDLATLSAAAARLDLEPPARVTASALGALKPYAFFQRMWDAGVIEAWYDDPDLELEGIERAFTRGSWKPSIAR